MGELFVTHFYKNVMIKYFYGLTPPVDVKMNYPIITARKYEIMVNRKLWLYKGPLGYRFIFLCLLNIYY